jgi:hypothetical protein
MPGAAGQVRQFISKQAVHVFDKNPYPSLQSVQMLEAEGQVRQLISVQTI